jgi:hypothetical protein
MIGRLTTLRGACSWGHIWLVRMSRACLRCRRRIDCENRIAAAVKVILENTHPSSNATATSLAIPH